MVGLQRRGRWDAAQPRATRGSLLFRYSSVDVVSETAKGSQSDRSEIDNARAADRQLVFLAVKWLQHTR